MVLADKYNMNIEDIEIDGYKKEYRKLSGTFQFEGFHSGILSDVYVTINVYESSQGGFYAEPDIGIRNNDGYPEYADRWGSTEKEAIINSLEKIKTLLSKHYPNIIPEHAFIYRTAENIEEEKEINSRFPRKTFNDSWRNDKLRRNLKGGPYIEFQLENEGSYIHWNDESIFVGNAVFDPVYKTFCRKQKDFDSYGINLFTVSELYQLNENISEIINFLGSITSISEYIEKVAPMYKWIHEPETPVWKELRDSIVEFLSVVHEIAEQDILENRALFVLGI